MEESEKGQKGGIQKDGLSTFTRDSESLQVDINIPITGHMPPELPFSIAGTVSGTSSPKWPHVCGMSKLSAYYQEGEEELDDLPLLDSSNFEHSTSQSSTSQKSLEEDEGRKGPRKKHRVTLPRGSACVSCRNKKLKCSGDKPCQNCERTGAACEYEEVYRKRPKMVMLEERVAELEGLLAIRGDTVPPSQLAGPSTTSSASVTPLKTTPTTLPFQQTVTPQTSPFDNTATISTSSVPLQPIIHPSPGVNALSIDIPPSSTLELGLITFILPYTPYLLMPLHPQRLIASLSTMPSQSSGSQRPHPALLYLLFAEAARILENDIPPPRPPLPPASLFPPIMSPSAPPPTMDRSILLEYVGGKSLALLERARVELDNGIRAVDRPFDLARASVGIARYLYSVGRFIEGWNVPVSRLHISCGTHRMVNVVKPISTTPNATLAPSFHPNPSLQIPIQAPAQPQMYNSPAIMPAITTTPFPALRMRPVIIPPPRDDIEIAERVMAFWAAKAQDWESGIGWGWTTSMADEECTTEWPWGRGSVEARPNVTGHFTIADLHDPQSGMHMFPFPDTTYVLAIKSLGLLHRSSCLFDLPESSLPAPISGLPTHIPPLTAIKAVESAIQAFRFRLPIPFRDIPVGTQDVSVTPVVAETYDGFYDPWWIMLHANMYTAEMLLYREMAVYQPESYDISVSCARALVNLVRRVKGDQWAHVAFNISLAARFLNKESTRLSMAGHEVPAKMASEEAEILRGILEGDYGRFLPMAKMHALIVLRVKEGYPDKEGEYERI